MARNDSRRLGLPAGASGTTTPAVMDVEEEGSERPSALSFVVPTEFVDLPSKGLYYPEKHPLHKVDCIEIRHMTAKDEDILTSKTLLRKGVALDRFLQNIVVNKKVDVRKMLVGDKNALVIAARISGYGADYDTRVVCPACTEKVEHSFDLNNAEIVSADDIDFEFLETKQTERGTFIFTLPKMNVEAEVRLLTGSDEMEIVRMSEQNKKNKKVESLLTFQLARMLVSINGDADRKTISYVIDNMPASDSRYLRKKYQAITPTVDLTQNFECVECGHEGQMEVPFTTDFFWPDR